MAIKRAKESFSYWDKGGVPRDISAGTLIDTDKSSEMFKGREHLFEDLEVYMDRSTPSAVESATATPGEKRSFVPPSLRDKDEKGSK